MIRVRTSRFLLLVAVCSASLATLCAHAAVGIGDVPPDALGKDRNGEQVHVSDYRGKVVVLTFWASWCSYCREELPLLENMQRRVGKDRITVVAVNTDKERKDYLALRRGMTDFELTMTADERTLGIAKEYDVTGLPHMLMIDKSGRVSAVHVGYSKQMLPRIVDEINALLDAPMPVASSQHSP